MRNFLIIFNVVLALAVAYLYYVHFEYVQTDVHKDQAQEPASPNSFKIAYFDLDSLENNYEYFKEQRNYLKTKNDQLEKKLTKMQNDYMAKVNDYNRRGPTLSQAEQTQIQDQLMKMRNDYQEQEQNLSQALQAETMQKMLDIKSKIQNFLKEYGKEKGYTYVFATSSDDNFMYYKDTMRNITDDIVRKLNEQNTATSRKK